MFRKTNISYPLIHIRTYEYQGVRNVGFSKNFAFVMKAKFFEKPTFPDTYVCVSGDKKC